MNKGLIGDIADLFDSCAEVVEEVTGKKAKKIRRTANATRKFRVAALKAAQTANRAKEIAEKSGITEKIKIKSYDIP